MSLRAVILWLHVACGVAWIAACASFILAVTPLGSEPAESYSFATRILPRINRLCVPLALVIPLTGIGNLLFAVQARSSGLPSVFIEIVFAKVGLLAIMALGLIGAWRTEQKIKAVMPIAASDMCDATGIRPILVWYGCIVGAGMVALGLGLWLSGT